MPRTPRALRPIQRTSLQEKRTALPEVEVNNTSPVPSVMSTPINLSSASRSIAIIPLARGR